MLLYLLDANVLITANNLYYPLKAVPEFWGWLEYKCAAGQLKVPVEILEEVTDEVGDWLLDRKDTFCLGETANMDLVRDCVSRGYAPDLNDSELVEVGNDPFLIAAALVAPHERVVVTTEVSKPTRRRGNRHIPDVCNSLGVQWCDSFAMLRTLGFTTAWRNGSDLFGALSPRR